MINYGSSQVVVITSICSILISRPVGAGVTAVRMLLVPCMCEAGWVDVHACVKKKL